MNWQINNDAINATIDYLFLFTYIVSLSVFNAELERREIKNHIFASLDGW